MSEALPALAFGAINSVIALLGNPPPAIRSRNSKPVVRTDVGAGEGWGKRAASNFRRSTIFLADMPNFGIGREYVQANILRELRRQILNLWVRHTKNLIAQKHFYDIKAPMNCMLARVCAGLITLVPSAGATEPIEVSTVLLLANPARLQN